MQLLNFHSPCLKAFFTIRKHSRNTKFVLFSKRSEISKIRIFLCRHRQNEVDTAYESPDIILFNWDKIMIIRVNTCWLKGAECASQNIKIISMWNVYALISQQVKPIISKGSLRESFCFFFSLERFPKSILVVWPREWYQINLQNICNKRIEPIFDWRSQNFFWDLQSSFTVSFSHLWMSKWVKNGFRNFENPFLKSKNQIFFFSQ